MIRGLFLMRNPAGTVGFGPGGAFGSGRARDAVLVHPAAVAVGKAALVRMLGKLVAILDFDGLADAVRHGRTLDAEATAINGDLQLCHCATMPLCRYASG